MVEPTEIWVNVEGGSVSSFGRAKNPDGKLLTLCPTKFRYHMNGKAQYASRLIASAFKIEGYELLDTQSYVVSFKDGNKKNLNIENLKIIHKSDSAKNIKNKPRQSERFKEGQEKKLEDYKDVERRIIFELPHHIIFKNGDIYNNNAGRGNKRFISGVLSEGYLIMNTKDAVYKMHRLICYAFHPIDGKVCLDDYSDLQVNHKDGNKLNNNADNLEWVKQSDNMQHAYNTKLNKKIRGVVQCNIKGEFIKEFDSIADAARSVKTDNEKQSTVEQRIRTACKNNYYTCGHRWKYKNPELSEEYSKKYSSL